MKKINIVFLAFVIFLFLGIQQGFAQNSFNKVKGNGHIVKSSRILPSFDKISASGIDNVTILTGNKGQNSLMIETDENLLPFIHSTVKNGTLNLYYKNLKATKLKFYVMVSALSGIKASGASNIISGDSLVGQHFSILTSGASNVKLLLNYKDIQIGSSGASDISLSGICQTMKVELSGAADMKAAKLKVDSVFIKASGASTARVNALKYLNKDISGIANLKLASPSERTIKIEANPNRVGVVTYGNNKANASNDTTRVNIGSLQLEVVNGDSTKIKFGGHTLIVGENGNVRWRRNNNKKFKGHWAGVDLGMNGYLNPKYNADFGKTYDFLTLQYEKSFNVNINLFEQNLALNKANTIGLITGVGLSFYDYRFANPVYLDLIVNSLTGYYIQNVSVRKSKLSVFYANIPLILEFQTNNAKRSKRFFFGVGVVANVRLRSHTKIYFNEADKLYSLENPATGVLINNFSRTPNRGNHNIIKSINNFNLNPFRFDATVRLGYKMISLFANYALSPMFQSGRGPDLRQWSVGITLVNW